MEATMTLPHTRDGNIDYKTLGNMITASLLGEVVCANAVDRDHCSEPAALIDPPTMKDVNIWQFYYKENDIVVLRKRLPHTKICCFMGRGVIDAPMDSVVNYLQKFQNRLEYDDTLLQIEVCQQFSDNDWLLYMAHKAKQCFFTSHRDFLYYCRTGYVEGKYILSSLSVNDKDYPHRPPYIRGEIKQGSGWVVEKHNDSECSSLVSYVAHLDLKDLPPIIVNRVLRRQPMSIKLIRERLTKPKVPLNFAATFIDSSQLQDPGEEDGQFEEYTSMNEFIENINVPQTLPKEDKPKIKRKVVINEESIKTSSPTTKSIRTRLYTNSLPEINGSSFDDTSSNASSSYYSTYTATTAEGTVTNDSSPPGNTTSEAVGDNSSTPSEDTGSVTTQQKVDNEETAVNDVKLSIKAMQANSVAQEFPSFNQWSGNGSEEVKSTVTSGDTVQV